MNRPDEVAAQGRRDLESSAEWRNVEREFFATGQAEGVQRALTRATDLAVIEAFESALVPVSAEGVTILAAGSYARGELFPFSEIEIITVRAGALSPEYDEAAAEFVRLLWERGVRPRYRICTVGEYLAAPEQNPDFGIKLLDRRVLAGNHGLAAVLEDKLSGVIAKNARQLGDTLAAVTRRRHARYRNTPFHREPDVIETPGGLLDLRVIAMLAKLWPQHAYSSEALGRAAAGLSALCCFLHYRAREDRNLLDTSAQVAIAEQFAESGHSLLSMQEYFRHARVVFNEARRALDSCEGGAGSLVEKLHSWQSRLSNEEFTVLRGRVYLREPVSLAMDAGVVFRLIEYVARHGIPPAPETERRLEAASESTASFCDGLRRLWPTLKSVFSLPHAAEALRVLRNTGLLPAIFPDWASIEGVPADGLDELYTLDEHTLFVTERICDLCANTDPARQRFSELFSGSDDQAILLFAVLFHRMGVQSAASSLAGLVARRFEMPDVECETVKFLIERQADLREVVSGRDLDDPVTVRTLSGAIGTVERLRLLTIFTCADLATTCSEAMLALRLEQLWQTYAMAERELTRELETDRIQELPPSLPAEAEFIRGFPQRYLRAYTTAEIEAHAQLYGSSRSEGVAVRLERFGGAYKLTVIAWDRPALFATLSGAISSFGLDIVKAEAFCNSRGIILDNFVVTDPRRTLELNPPEADRLQDLIRRAASGKTEVKRLLRVRPRRNGKAPAIEPQVRVDSEACETATLFEIVAEDRPGLLYSLAAVFSSNSSDIDLVLVDTRGARAMDVFYVARGGGKLSSEVQALLQEQLLAACRGD